MKIKWNWGTKLAIWIIAFIVFILTLVFMTTKVKVNLVEKDYYPKGLNYQSRIDAIENAKDINAVFISSQNENNVQIEIPDIESDSGTILFFRPSGHEFDKVYNIVTDTSNQLIVSKTDLKEGKYILKINWFNNGVKYYVEQNLFIK